VLICSLIETKIDQPSSSHVFVHSLAYSFTVLLLVHSDCSRFRFLGGTYSIISSSLTASSGSVEYDTENFE
jgi:hypothetical protein